MSSISDLASLSDVKAWIGESATATDDVLLTRMITAASRMILTMCGRGVLTPQNYTENFYPAPVGNRIMLRNWPVTAISSVTLDTASLLATSNPFTYGYMLEDSNTSPPGNMQGITLVGGNWRKRFVSVAYTAGYQISNEAATIPQASPYTVSALTPFGAWATDAGVTIAGLPATATTGTPTTGQYAVSSGVYTFAAADAGKAVALAYGFVPADLAQACIELVGERFRARERIGMVSKSLGGQETVTFSQKDMNAATRAAIMQYARKAPI